MLPDKTTTQEVRITVTDVEELTVSVDLDKAPRMRVYPNPAKDQLSIDPGPSEGNIKTIMIYDLRGVIVKQFEANPDHVYDVSDIRSGFYILSIVNHDHQRVYQTEVLIVD